MRMINTPYSTVNPDSRVSQDTYTLMDAIRTYFTILFGVAVLVLTYYYQFPQLH